MKWRSYFFEEMKKIAFPVGSYLMGASTIYDMSSQLKENKAKVGLEPLKDKEKQLQLPGSNAYQFEGGKRIDSSTITATNKF